MNAYFNYLLEANIGLLLFLAYYKLLLQRETNFRFLRIFLLSGIFVSLLFPLIHMQNNQGPSLFSISQVIPSYWLPEVVITGGATKDIHEASFNFWKYTTLIYAAGVMGSCLIVIFQLSQLFRIIHRSATYRLRRLQIAESTESKLTFSFFHFIFIGQADQLSSNEKQQIIQHESVHARQWHSFDILQINILKIFFWFNPFITTYKKILIQLHEFEADARAVENSDLNKYCSLLAKVALQSADYKLANHFNNSLTVKRIEMMRTIKSNMKRWKFMALGMLLPLVFFFIACQDQVGDDIMEITRNSTHALLVPEDIQNRFEQLQKENPDKKYVLLELNETASQKLQTLGEEYGLPRTIEVFKTSDGKTVTHDVKGEDAGIIMGQNGTAVSRIFMKFTDEPTDKDEATEIAIREAGPKINGQQTFAIIEFNEETRKISEASHQGDVFTVVEHQPEYTDGYDAMVKFIRENLRYPAEARMKGIEGTVFVSFIVEKDGAVSGVNLIRGISQSCDAEAERVVKLFPKWIPGKNKGEIVRVKFVLPIKFKL